jgi:hypothetical protein
VGGRREAEGVPEHPEDGDVARAHAAAEEAAARARVEEEALP